MKNNLDYVYDIELNNYYDTIIGRVKIVAVNSPKNIFWAFSEEYGFITISSQKCDEDKFSDIIYIMLNDDESDYALYAWKKCIILSNNIHLCHTNKTKHKKKLYNGLSENILYNFDWFKESYCPYCNKLLSPDQEMDIEILKSKEYKKINFIHPDDESLFWKSTWYFPRISNWCISKNFKKIKELNMFDDKFEINLSDLVYNMPLFLHLLNKDIIQNIDIINDNVKLEQMRAVLYCKDMNNIDEFFKQSNRRCYRHVNRNNKIHKYTLKYLDQGVDELQPVENNLNIHKMDDNMYLLFNDDYKNIVKNHNPVKNIKPTKILNINSIIPLTMDDISDKLDSALVALVIGNNTYIIRVSKYNADTNTIYLRSNIPIIKNGEVVNSSNEKRINANNVKKYLTENYIKEVLSFRRTKCPKCGNNFSTNHPKYCNSCGVNVSNYIFDDIDNRKTDFNNIFKIENTIIGK